MRLYRNRQGHDLKTDLRILIKKTLHFFKDFSITNADVFSLMIVKQTLKE